MHSGSASINFVGKEILCSGSVIVIDNKVEFCLSNLTYILQFDIDDEDKGTRGKAISNDGKSVVYSMINFNSILGSGFLEPIRFGTINNKKLMACFVVYSWGLNTRTLNYTWYLEDEDGKSQ